MRGPLTTEPPTSLRIPFVRRCDLRSDKGERVAMLLDLSLNGAYVATEDLPVVGESFLVSFRVPGNARRLRVLGLVAWVQAVQTHPVHGLPCGFGLRFTKLAIEDVRLLARTIRRYCQSNPLYRQYL